MAELLLTRKALSDLYDQLQEAVDMVVTHYRALKDRKESYDRAVIRGDIKPSENPVVKVKIHRVVREHLAQLGRDLVNLFGVEEEG